MIGRPRGTIERIDARNIEILAGDATYIPLPDSSVDVVTSNGVLNLVPDKVAAFAEIHRVLRPGGRLQLADIVVQEDVGTVCGLNPQLWADCIGGAGVGTGYLGRNKAAGRSETRVPKRLRYICKS